MFVDKMKPWQYGYELEILKSLEQNYRNYNAFALSPFSQIKKNDIAKALHDKNFIYHLDLQKGYEVSFLRKVIEKKGKFTLYQDIVVGEKYPGDIVISGLVGPTKQKERILREYSTNNNCWYVGWKEDLENGAITRSAGFEYVGGKITSNGEIYGLWFRNASDGKGLRIHPILNSIEKVGIKLVGSIRKDVLDEVTKQYLNLLPKFGESERNGYNEKYSWAALALRGYTSDPFRFEKPSEMSQKWQDEHKHENFQIQYTSLANKFPMVLLELQRLFGLNVGFDRILFMKMKVGNKKHQSELFRHTDLCDKDFGFTDGKIMRFHIPIITNDGCIGTHWNINGTKEQYHMKEGEVWMYDTRKPHAAVNNGDIERIHLVADVVMTENIRQKIMAT